MIKVVRRLEGKLPSLVLGLTRDDVTKLQDGSDILLDLRSFGLPAGFVHLSYAEDDQAVMEGLKSRGILNR